MQNTIKITSLNSTVLEIELLDILSNIDTPEKYKWSILWLEAMAKDEDFPMLDFEKKVNESKNGQFTSSQNLIELGEACTQIIEILLIADMDRNKLKRYESDSEMKKSCQYCIELIDSSFWEITSKDENFLLKLREKFDLVRSS
ncbi:hypothetical protein [Saprospira grandis]|uniref:hypothetical protein n=1 Tax=Saprospira grandis TaxID=1008 RepID=UPI0022DDE3E0|nr:hypothetical protein [Saprospira grandis]WBM74098.1 hypothetical protein OP864_14010 [Saprospira grandis]